MEEVSVYGGTPHTPKPRFPALLKREGCDERESGVGWREQRSMEDVVFNIISRHAETIALPLDNLQTRR